MKNRYDIDINQLDNWWKPRIIYKKQLANKKTINISYHVKIKFFKNS